MKDVLTLYAQAYEPKRPTVCFDEKSLQLLASGRRALPMKPGAPLRQDPDYVRQGTRNLFLFVEPKTGQRHTLVTRHRTKEDFAKVMRYLVDQIYPGVDLIDVVLDHLNTHTTQAVIEIFGQPEADRILRRVKFHYTPVHASWLNTPAPPPGAGG
jgi:DDE superfamily endonuclease